MPDDNNIKLQSSPECFSQNEYGESIMLETVLLRAMLREKYIKVDIREYG